MTNVDHIAEVVVGVVVVVTLLFLLAVGEALGSECPFLVKQAMTLLKIFCCMLLFQLGNNYYCWRRCRQVLLGSSLGFYDRGGSSFHVVGKILVEVIRIVVVEIEMLRGVILWLLVLFA